MQADGSQWQCLYIPRRENEVRANPVTDNIELGKLRMVGREVYKFAVPKLVEIIDAALKETGMKADQIDHFVCHQSNARIIESAITKLDLPADRVHMNIEYYGNSSAGSVGLCLDDLWRAGKVKKGDVVLFIAVGGGLTWAVNIWRV